MHAGRAAQSVLFGSLGLGKVRNGVAHVVCVVDRNPSELGRALLEGYRSVASNAANLRLHSLVFSPESFETDLDALTNSVNQIEKNAVVACVLIQKGAFQNDLRSYRLRLRLFDRGLRVAEHSHLGSMSDVHEQGAYIKSCTLDALQSQLEGEKICSALDRLVSPAAPLRIFSETRDRKLELTFNGYLEKCLVNSGFHRGVSGQEICVSDFRNRAPKGVGGSFPVGEVITELEDLRSVQGRCAIFGFPDTSKRVRLVDPFEVEIDGGSIVAVDSSAPKEFAELVDLIRNAEGDVTIREIGIGLNPHLGRHAYVSDVTAFERQFGIHLSLGKRHPLFPKRVLLPTAERPLRTAAQNQGLLRRKDGVFHIDVFLNATRLSTEMKTDSFEMRF